MVPVFVSKSYDLLKLDENDKKKIINDKEHIDKDNKYISDKANMMLIISCVLIIVGIILSSVGCNSTTMGLSYAGLLLLLSTLLTNWSFYSLKCQVIILGACILTIGTLGLNRNLMKKLLFC